MALDKPILLTDNYAKTRIAKAVPYSYYSAGGWYIPPDPDPESARMALRLFPQLVPQHPELVARARLSAVDHSPVNYSDAAWSDRPLSADPWQRVLAIMSAL